MTHTSFLQMLWQCLVLLLPCALTAQERTPLGHWVAEDQSGLMDFTLREDTLELIVPEGLTLWYKDRLTGDYQLSYHICMVMNGGEHDRLSDLNCFWAANDPQHPGKLFARSTWRNGIFRNYNTLNLFYVGYGGNDNTTTRFRRYHGQFYGVDEARIKPLLKEYTDAPHLLKPNHWYHILIRVQQGYTTFSVDGEELFRHPIEPGDGDGHFGLRLLQNHVRFTGFRIEPLDAGGVKGG